MKSKTLRGGIIGHTDPFSLIGKRVPAADGGDYGQLIVGFDEIEEELLVIPIVWSTGEPFHKDESGLKTIDLWKAKYRYQLDKAV